MRSLFTQFLLLLFLMAGVCNIQAQEPLPTPFFEGFEAEDVFESSWTVLDVLEDGVASGSGKWSRMTAMKNSGLAAAGYRFNSANSADDWMFSPGIQLEAGKSYKLKWWDYSSGSNEEKYAVYIGSDKDPDNQIMIGDDHVIQTGMWTLRTEMINITTSGVYYLSWHCYSDRNKATLYIDDISLEESVAIDMKMIEITGSKEATVQSPVTHSVTMQNNGSATISTFILSILDEDNNSLASIPYTGDALNADDTATMEITWTPTASMEGNHTIQVSITAPNDAVAANNTIEFDMLIHPFATFMHHIGNLESTTFSAITPFYFNAKNAGTQNIYFEEEIPEYGYIKALRYYTDFRYDNVPEQSIKIFLNTTERTELSGQWVLNNQLVYEGEESYEMGKYEITFILDEPYLYTGGNLVVTTSRSGTAKSGKNFKHTAALNKTARSRYATDSQKPFDYSQTGSVIAVAPNVSLLIEANGGSINGTVTAGNNVPVEDVVIKAVSDMNSYETLTDEEGNYVLNFLPVGEYEINAAKTGYVGEKKSATTSYQSEETIDFVINSLVEVTVTGVVESNGNGLANATVVLLGEKEYFILTDENGSFTIENVFGSRIYDIIVSAVGHISYESSVTVNELDVDLGSIELITCVNNELPVNLSATLNTPEWYTINLMWEAPTGTVAGYRVYRDGTLLNKAELLTETTFVEAVATGTYLYEVSSVSEDGCESARINKTIEMLQDPCELAINTFPYIEGFEAGEINRCWEQEFIVGMTPWEVTSYNEEYNSEPFNGSFNAKIESMHRGTITKLILPFMDITEMAEPVLNFRHLQVNFGVSTDEIRVYYKNTADGEWTELAAYTNPVTNWKERTIALPNPSATYYIAFEATIDYGRGAIIDEIKVLDNALCAPINNLTLEQPAEREVKLTWDEPHSTGVKSYKILRDKAEIKTIAAAGLHNSYIDTNVDINTYEYAVSAIYEGKTGCTESDPISISITTVEMCDPASGLVLEQQEENTVELSWQAPNASKISSYSVLRDGIEIASVNETTYTDTEVENGFYEYCVVVNYENKACAESEAICESNFLSICDPVINLDARYDDEESVINLTWDINMETGFEIALFHVYRNNQLMVKTPLPFYIDWRVELGSEYTYSVKAEYINGCTSSLNSITIGTDCIAPVDLSASLTEGDNNNYIADLSWDSPEGKSQESLAGTEFITSPVPMDASAFTNDTVESPSMTENAGILPAPSNTQTENEDMLYTSGPFKTHDGIGYNGKDISYVEATHETRGIDAIGEWGYMVGEDFVLEERSHISEIEVFAYVFYEDLPISKITGIYVAIFKGHPILEYGEMIWGNFQDNRLSSTEFTGVYRVPTDDYQNPYRPIMNVKATIDTELPQGTYWIMTTLFSSVEPQAGPHLVPVTIIGQKNTGNAFQYSTNGFWTPVTDAKHGETMGIAMNVYGNTVSEKFNIYRDDQLIASNIEGFSYQDTGAAVNQSHTWEVAHICGSNESDAAVYNYNYTGIDEIGKLNSIVVHPNPTNDYIVIKGEEVQKAEIYTVSGQLVDTVKVNDQRISMRKYPEGMYIVKLYTSQNTVEVKQVIVTK